MITTRMQVEEENVPFKGSSKLTSSKSKIKLVVGGIVFVILIIIIIVLMLPKTIKQNDCKYILSTSVPKVAFLQEVFSLSLPSVCPQLTTVYLRLDVQREKHFFYFNPFRHDCVGGISINSPVHLG